MPRKEVTQHEFIEHQNLLIEKSRKRMLKEFSTLTHTQMQGLINDVNYSKSLIGFAKSGKMQFYFI